jgi:alcohol dehydrogenase
MPIRCKAAVLRQSGAPAPFADSKPIVIEEVELADPKATEVVIKIGGSGLCHSDLSVINGDRPRPTPLVLGHEGSGEIVEVGSAITDVAVGDHIVFQFSASCGRCRRCLEGRPQVCEVAAVSKGAGELMAGGSRITSMNGERIAHHAGVSCMSEYAVSDRGSIVVIDKSLPLADAALFGCAVMTGVGAVINTARILPGDTVAIVGLGGVGLNGILGAKLGGAEKIIAIDLEDSKLGLARQLGATHTVNARDADAVQQVRDISNGGVDYAVDLAGTIPAMDTAYAITRYGGSVVTAGLSPSTAKFSFTQGDLVSQEKSIRGSYMGSCVPVRDIPRFISLYQQGRLPVDALIDGYVGFDELNAGFDKLQDVKTVRQILAPHA